MSSAGKLLRTASCCFYVLTNKDPDTTRIIEVDITDRVFYVNAATGMIFIFNSSHKNDPSFGYGMRAPGWQAFAGAISK